MSLLSIAPDIVAGASGDLENLGAALRSATAAAATQTTSIAAPAADEVSAAVTALFGTHAEAFQALSAKAAAFHDDFVNLLSGGAARYVGSEAANVPSLGSAATAAQSYSGKFGPFEYSVTETATSLDASVTLLAALHPSLSLNASSTSSGGSVGILGTLKTPLGTVDWLSASGSATSSPDGAFQASLSAQTPFAPPVSLSVNGTPTSSGGDVSVLGTFKTPVGTVDWLTANGSLSSTSEGEFEASLIAHTPFTPQLSFSLSGTPEISATEIEETLQGTGKAGPLTILTVNGNATLATDGAVSASITAHTPIGFGEASLTGTETDDGALQITGGSIDIDGLTYKF